MTSLVKVFRGGRHLKGADAADGENGFGVEDVNGSIVDNPVLDLFKNNKLTETGAVTWARAGDGLIIDRYGEYGFVTGNDIANYMPYSNDFTQWVDFLGLWSISSTGNADPLGGNNATYIVLDSTTLVNQPVLSSGATVPSTDLFNTISFWFKLVSGTVSDIFIKIAGTTIQVPITITSEYQRVSVTAGVEVTSSAVDINPVGLVGSVFSVFGVQFENSSVLHDYLETTGTPVTIPNPFPIARSNNFGYLFEDSKANLIAYSENLTKPNWTVESGTISAYGEPDLFGDSFKNINVTFNTNATVTVRSTGTFTQGLVYTLSFFVKLLSGTLDSVSASIAGSSSQMLGDLLETGYTRYSITAVAGAGGTIDISFISSNKNADLLLLGFQTEINGLSSYIRTTGQANTRPEDDCNIPYNLMGAGDPWSLSFSHYGLINDASEKHVFNNGLSGSDEFSMMFLNDTLKVKIGSVTTTFSTVLASKFIGVTFGGATIKLYLDGRLNSTQANAGASGAVPTTLYIGSDETATNSINAFMSNFKFYDSQLSANNIRYLVGDIV